MVPNKKDIKKNKKELRSIYGHDWFVGLWSFLSFFSVISAALVIPL
jgi:hypothetical protein